jgi:hypothetical protein
MAERHEHHFVGQAVVEPGACGNAAVSGGHAKRISDLGAKCREIVTVELVMLILKKSCRMAV